MRKAPNNNNNIENQNQQLESSVNDSGLLGTDINQETIQKDKEKHHKKQLAEAEYLTQMLKEGDTDKLYSHFFKLNENDIKYINYIKNGGKPKDISKELAFLNNSQYIEHTRKEYEEIFEKTKKGLNEIDVVFEIHNIINQGGDIDNHLHDFRRNKIFKNIKKLQKYEKGEFINFPNGIVFELEKGPIAELNITDSYIKTHVEKDTGHYIEYVKSLLTAKGLFKNKGINIKYCRRETRLANREFIEAYEKIRKIKKGKEYEKPNRLKVLEQTEQAVIFEKAKNSNPIRFIKEGTDLHDFATGEGVKIFHETEMRLDLNRLEIINGLKEKNNHIIENYNIKDIINNEKIQPKEKIHTIINIIHNDIKNGDDHRKITIDGKILPFSCGNKALILHQIFKEYGKELGITESHIAQPNGHVMNVVKFNGDLCIADSSDGTMFANIEQNHRIRHIENIDVIELKKPLKNKHGEYNYTRFPIINAGNKTELYESAALEEYDLSVKQKMYQKASTNDYNKLKTYVETIISSDELNPLNYFTGEKYLGVAKNKEDIEYKNQIKELEYLMQDTRSLNEIQERRKILQNIKQELGVNEDLIDKINNNQSFFNKISKSIAKFFKKSGY